MTREELEALDNEELFGEESWDNMREEQLENLVTDYQFQLVDTDDEVLFGHEALQELREKRIEAMLGDAEGDWPWSPSSAPASRKACRGRFLLAVDEIWGISPKTVHVAQPYGLAGLPASFVTGQVAAKLEGTRLPATQHRPEFPSR